MTENIDAVHMTHLFFYYKNFPRSMRPADSNASHHVWPETENIVKTSMNVDAARHIDLSCIHLEQTCTYIYIYIGLQHLRTVHARLSMVLIVVPLLHLESRNRDWFELTLWFSVTIVPIFYQHSCHRWPLIWRATMCSDLYPRTFKSKVGCR